MEDDQIELTNFQFKSSNINLSEIIKPYWINDKETIKDFSFNHVESTFLGFSDNFNEKVEDQWKKLQIRAKNGLVNKPAVRWEGFDKEDPKSFKINLSQGINYKSIVGVRSNEDIYSDLDQERSPKAFVLASVLITKDNKLVMGKRKFYGDWPPNTYECPGAFIHEEDLKIDSVIKIAKSKIEDDYQVSGFEIQAVPFAVYYLPRLLEVVTVCISKISLKADELKSDLYNDILSVDNTSEGLEKLVNMPLDLFHSPSRTIIQFYWENFSTAQEILKNSL